MSPIHQKIVKKLGLAFILCFLVNIFHHHQWLTSLLNSSSLLLCLIVFHIHHPKILKKLPILFILSISLIPLFRFQPKIFLISYIQIATSILWIISIKKNKFQNPIIFIEFVLLFVGTLISTNLLTLPFDINKEQLIFFTPSFEKNINAFQKNSLYALFPLRPIIYNQSIYLYHFLGNIAKFISPKNLYDTLLIANIYPLIIGISTYVKKDKNIFLFIGILTILIGTGIAKSTDKFNSLYLAAPFLTYNILSGLRKINTKIYTTILFFSIINSFLFI